MLIENIGKRERHAEMSTEIRKSILKLVVQGRIKNGPGSATNTVYPGPNH